MPPSKDDIRIYKKSLIASVESGIADAEAGKVYTTDELKKELEKRRAIRKSNSKNSSDLITRTKLCILTYKE